MAVGIGAGVDGQMGPGMGIDTFVADAGRFEKLTRDDAKGFGDYVINQAASAGAIAPVGSSVAQYNAPQATMRDLTTVRPYNTGIVAVTGDNGVVAAPERQGAFLQLDRHAKRGDQVVGWTGPMKGTRPDSRTHGKVGIKDSRERSGRLMGGAELQIARPSVNAKSRGNDTRLARKTPAENSRLWNTLAAKQLRNNPFAKTMAEI